MQPGISRTAAWDLLCEWTAGESLRRHALAVERGIFAGKMQRQPMAFHGELGLRQHAGHRRRDDIGQTHRRPQHAGTIDGARGREFAEAR